MCECGVDRNNTKCIKAQWLPTLSCSSQLLASYKLSYVCLSQTHRDQTNAGKLGEQERKKKQQKNSPLHKIDASFISFDAISSNRLMIAMMLIVIQVEYIVVIIYIAGCSVMHKDAQMNMRLLFLYSFLFIFCSSSSSSVVLVFREVNE